MTSLRLECPFCLGEITAQPFTTERERAAGLVYLLAKCIPCDSRFESVGLGDEAAAEDMARILRKRVGTLPEYWRLQTPQARRNRR